MVSFQYHHILLRLTSLLALPESTLRSSDVVFLMGLRCCCHLRMGIISFKYGFVYFSPWKPYLTAIGSLRYNQRVKQFKCCAFGYILCIDLFLHPKVRSQCFLLKDLLCTLLTPRKSEYYS